MSGRELGEAAGLLCGADEPLSGWAGPGLGPSHITTRRACSPPGDRPRQIRHSSWTDGKRTPEEVRGLPTTPRGRRSCLFWP